MLSDGGILAGTAGGDSGGIVAAPRRDIHPNRTRPAVITVERGTRSNKITPMKTWGSLAVEVRVVL